MKGQTEGGGKVGDKEKEEGRWGTNRGRREGGGQTEGSINNCEGKKPN